MIRFNGTYSVEGMCKRVALEHQNVFSSGTFGSSDLLNAKLTIWLRSVRAARALIHLFVLQTETLNDSQQ